jgi:ELWxxDGT repeat protein
MRPRARTLNRWLAARRLPARKSPWRRQLTVELLEDRSLLSVAPVAVGIYGVGASVAVNGTLFFSTAGAIWKTDGTPAGTGLVKDGLPTGGTEPANLTAVNGTLFFTCDDVNTGDTTLWKSDGTAAGTAVVTDFGGTSDNGGVFPQGLTNVNGTLFFTTQDSVNGEELWTSDGTAAGTAVVAQLDASADFIDPQATNVNGTVFFTTHDGVNGAQLWASDGTAAGTAVLKTDADPADGGSAEMTNLTSFQGRLLFTTDDGGNGAQLWSSDGTAAGTVLVADFSQPDDPSSVGNMTAVNGTLFFVTNDGTNGQLWESNGTAAGTTLVHAWTDGSSPDSLTAVNGALFFTTTDANGDQSLWTSDGTDGGTVGVTGAPSGTIYGLTSANGLLYFTATANDAGTSTLWQSDGTAAGTTPVQASSSTDQIANPWGGMNVNRTLMFFGDAQPPPDGNVTPTELWVVSPGGATAPTPVDLEMSAPTPILYPLGGAAGAGAGSPSPATPGITDANVGPVASVSGGAASVPATAGAATASSAPVSQTAPTSVAGATHSSAPRPAALPVLPPATDGGFSTTPVPTNATGSAGLAQSNAGQTAAASDRSGPVATPALGGAGGESRGDDGPIPSPGDSSDSTELPVSDTTDTSDD